MNPPILFITRNYPPKVGGLEIYSYHLIRQFERAGPVFKITLGRSRAHLFWFLPFCLLRAFWLCRRHRVFHIHICDGLLAPVGLVLKGVTRARVTASVHGLDVTFPLRAYQLVVPWCLARLDLVFCGSRHGLGECRRRRVPDHKLRVVPYGIDPGEFEPVPPEPAGLREIEKRAGSALDGRKILLSIGRLVPRKGVAWFVAEVMPRLGAGYCYLIGGAGPELPVIRRLIEAHGLSDRAVLLGRVSNELRRQLMARADLFVMPNIRIPGDMEGFGIAALEAGSSGLPVIASDLEGLRDAVIEGVTGHLVQERNARQYAERIRRAQFARESVRSAVNARFNWPRVASLYQGFIFDAAGVRAGEAHAPAPGRSPQDAGLGRAGGHTG